MQIATFGANCSIFAESLFSAYDDLDIVLFRTYNKKNANVEERALIDLFDLAHRTRYTMAEYRYYVTPQSKQKGLLKP